MHRNTAHNSFHDDHALKSSVTSESSGGGEVSAT